MATRILLPKQGLQMAEGTIVSWLVKPGQKVSRGQAIVEVETDKTVMPIESPVDGVLLAALHAEGETVPVATTIAWVGEPGEKVPETGSVGVAASAEASSARQAAPLQDASPAAATPSSAAGPSRHSATPRARMRAEERRVDLRGISGSGPEGLIIERDVLQAGAAAASSTAGEAMAAAPAPAAAPAAPAPLPEGELVPFTAMRATIARRMKESLAAAAQACHQVDVDCTELVRLRSELKRRQIDVTVTDVIVKVLGAALRGHPMMNSQWTDRGILLRKDVNVGVAVALEDGLVVPVIRDADTCSLAVIHERSQDLAARAREGKLRREEMQGAGFTVSNLGMLGIDRFTAIIDQPQSGILAVGRITGKPVAVGNAVEVRDQMTLTLSYDHRVIDGAPAARFLSEVRRLLEGPWMLL
jgi:pyruvate dehydrogenase E2 component (dihydrolipoamide acetyltransferase)